MPPMMSQGRRDRLDIDYPVLSGEVEGLLQDSNRRFVGYND